MPASQPELGPIDPGRDAVDVWRVDLQEPGSLAKSLAALADEERQRAGQFQSEPARRRFAITRAAVRSILGRYLPCSPPDIHFELGASGKPRLASGNTGQNELHFNVAHSGDLALVAVALGCEVGVDVEQLRTVAHFEQIASRYFHPQEVATLAAAPAADRAAAFLRCWTCKEAVLKAVGVGVTGPLDQFYVPFHQDGVSRIDMAATGNLTCWLQPLVLDMGYFGAVVSVGERRRVQWKPFSIEFVGATSRE